MGNTDSRPSSDSSSSHGQEASTSGATAAASRDGSGGGSKDLLQGRFSGGNRKSSAEAKGVSDFRCIIHERISGRAAAVAKVVQMFECLDQVKGR